MQFEQFLTLTKVIRMLFGRPLASKFFLDNIGKFDNIVDSASISKLLK